MGGVLTHLIVGFVGAGIVYFFYREIFHSLGFFVGQILPDAIKFGIPGVLNSSYKFNEIIAMDLFWTLNGITNSVLLWGIIFGTIVIVSYGLWKIERISYLTFIKIFYFSFYLIVGVYLHLGIDFIYLEKSYWI